MGGAAADDVEMEGDSRRSFPNTDQGSRVVLYPLSGGGVGLDWRLPKTLVEQAADAFPGRDARPKLYLYRVDGAGGRLAEALLNGSCGSGQSRFEEPVTGRLQVEIGLEADHGGGWMLLARSNRLDAIPPPQPLNGAQRPRPQGAEVHPERLSGPPPTPQSKPETEAQSDLKPELRPEPAPPLRPVVGNARQGASLVAQAPGALAQSPPEPTARQRPAAALWLPRTQRLLVQASAPQSETPSGPVLIGSAPAPGQCPTDWQGLVWRGPVPAGLMPAPDSRLLLQDGPSIRCADAFRTTEVRRPSPLVARPQHPSRYPDPSLQTESAWPLTHGRLFPLALSANFRERSGPAARTPSGRPDRDPVETELGQYAAAPLDPQAASGQDSGRSGRVTAPGSGPLAPWPSLEAARVQGQLRVFGSAPPGSLLDLGGHRLRVGPGGRFAFVVDLDDPALLVALLARLPRLPVAERNE